MQRTFDRFQSRILFILFILSILLPSRRWQPSNSVGGPFLSFSPTSAFRHSGSFDIRYSILLAVL